MKRTLFRRIVGWPLFALAVFAVWHWRLPHERTSKGQVRELVLRSELPEVRRAMDNFIADKKRAPKLLQGVVDEKYLRTIPGDPMTGPRDWRISDAIFAPDVLVAAFVEGHSASKEIGPG
jgi:hypothetical protein